MNNKKARKIMTFVFITLLFSLLLGLILTWTLGNKQRTVKTEFGDEFNVRFDDFRAQSTLEDPNSLFYLVIDGEISDNSIKGLKHTSSLTVYRIMDTAFFDDGNGFEIFDEDTDLKAHAEVAEIVKENLNCDERFYKRYKKILERPSEKSL